MRLLIFLPFMILGFSTQATSECRSILLSGPGSTAPSSADLGYEFEIPLRQNLTAIPKLVRPIKDYASLPYRYPIIQPGSQFGFVPSSAQAFLNQLSLAQQGQLLQAMKPVTFPQKRTLADLQLQDRLRLHFGQATSFFGSQFLPGSYDIFLKDLFRPEIENMEPYSTRLTGVELHSQSSLPASQFLASIQFLFRQLRIENSGLHVHVVGKVPLPEHTLGVTEFVRRVNILGEIRTALAGFSLRTEQEGLSIRFAVLDREEVFRVEQQISNPDAWDSYLPQAATASPRFKTYTQQDGVIDITLWGIEMRYGHRQWMWDDFASDVEVVRKIISERLYGKFQGELAQWASQLVGHRLSQDLLHYAHQSFLDAFFDKRPVDSPENYFILHPWEKDPIFSNSRDAAEAMKSLRKKYEIQLSQASQPAQRWSLTQSFLKESNLLATVFRSLSF